MRHTSLIVFLLLMFPVIARAFTIKGLVRDASSGEALRGVVIRNLNTGNIVYSDSTGNFFLLGKTDDLLSLRTLGYAEATRRLSASDETNVFVIEMKRQDVMIDTVVIRSLTQYQKDSLARREIYGQALDKKPVKFGLVKGDPLYGGGPKGAVTFNAPISSLIQKRTKKYKRLKAFQDRFQNDEKQSYIDSRYTPALVTELTGLQNDSLVLFMKTFPVAYDFSRSATELELKMLIKYNYRTWMQSKAAPAAKP